MEDDHNLPDLSNQFSDGFWDCLDLSSLQIPTELQPNLDLNLPDLSGTMHTQLMECDSTVSPFQQPLHLMQPAPQIQQISEEPDADVLTRPNFEGMYGFKIVFPNEDQSRSSKDSSWTYSEVLEELFSKLNSDCPVQVQLSRPVPHSSFIRVSPYYRRADFQNETPKRCFNHKDPHHELNRDHSARKHLIRSYMPGAEHIVDEATKRREVLLPCHSSYSTGTKLLTYVLRFMCYTSCSGGMNRRPFCVVFTLENNGKCLGRQVKKVHVSACPRRDRRLGEKRLQNSTVSQPTQNRSTTTTVQSGIVSTGEPQLARDIKRACKRLATSSEGSGKQRKTYKLTVTSRKVYNILCAMLPVIDASLKNKESPSTEED